MVLGVLVLVLVSKKWVKVKKEKKLLVFFIIYLILNIIFGNGVIFSIIEISKGVKKVVLILFVLNSFIYVYVCIYID